MKILSLLLSALFALSAFGVITERYVTAAGAGNLSGTNEANAMSWSGMVTDINAGGKGGFRYNVKGTVSLGAATTISGSGVNTNYLTIEGYSVTPGDGYTGYNSDGSLNTTNFATITLGTTFRFTVTGSFINFRCLNITGNANNSIFATTGGNGNFVQECRVANSSNGTASSAAALFMAANCDLVLTYGAGSHSTTYALTSGTSSRFVGLRIYCTTGGGVNLASGGRIVNSLIYGSGANTLDGVFFSATSANNDVINCTIAGWARDGIRAISGVTTSILYFNNLITDNTAWGINYQGSLPQVIHSFKNNRFRNNGSGNIAVNSNHAEMLELGSVTTAGSDYVDSANGDFSLLSTSPAVNAGFRPNVSIGALQRSQTGSSGPRFFVTP